VRRRASARILPARARRGARARSRGSNGPRSGGEGLASRPVGRRAPYAYSGVARARAKAI
ncbi:hypothetical protein, partial [Xylella fastidiosa]|uniref:hypothetical protein n=1 Tax=Xylella fastidiosa TaxID=2371 RepID=UPI001EEB37FB